MKTTTPVQGKGPQTFETIIHFDNVKWTRYSQLLLVYQDARLERLTLEQDQRRTVELSRVDEANRESDGFILFEGKDVDGQQVRVHYNEQTKAGRIEAKIGASEFRVQGTIDLVDEANRTGNRSVDRSEDRRTETPVS